MSENFSYKLHLRKYDENIRSAIPVAISVHKTFVAISVHKTFVAISVYKTCLIVSCVLKIKRALKCPGSKKSYKRHLCLILTNKFYFAVIIDLGTFSHNIFTSPWIF